MLRNSCLAILGLVAVAGCDFFGSSSESKLKLEQMRLEQQRAEQEAEQKEKRADSLKAYVSGMAKLVDERRIAASNRLAAVTRDSEALENAALRVMAEKDKQGKDLSNEVKMLRMLKDADVNALAVKYLSAGFSVQAESFVEKIRAARDGESRYQGALQRSEAAYDGAMEEIRGLVGSSKNQREAEIRRLKNEIGTLEKKRATTRREMVAAGSQRREWLNKMSDYESEIAKKRWQVDALQNPHSIRHVEAQAANERQTIQDRASAEHRIQLADIDRRLKPKETVLSVTTEMEAQTLGKLRAEIQRQKREMASAYQDLERKHGVSKELLLAIPVANLQELERIRVRADRELAAK